MKHIKIRALLAAVAVCVALPICAVSAFAEEEQTEIALWVEDVVGAEPAGDIMDMPTITAAPAEIPEGTVAALISAWNSDAPRSYPADVGGIFSIAEYSVATGSESYIYYVSLKGRTPEREAEILSLVSDPETIRFTDAKYSYAELCTVQRQIEEEMKNAVPGYVCVGVLQDANIVEVGVTEEKLAELSDTLGARFGDMVSVVSSDAILTTGIEEVGKISPAIGGMVDRLDNPTDNGAYIALAISVLALLIAAGAMVLAVRRGRLLRSDGSTEDGEGNGSLNRAQLIKRVEDSAELPPDETLGKIMQRIDRD